MDAPKKIGYGFYGPVGPKGMKVRTTFGMVGTRFVVLNVAAGMKEVPLARLAGKVATTPHGDEQAATWGAAHWTNRAFTVPDFLRKWAAFETKRGRVDAATLLTAMATYFEGVIPVKG